MDALQQLGFALIQALQTLSPALDGPMQLFSFLGRIEFYLLLIPFIYWAIDSSLGLRALLALLIADLFTSGFKLVFHQPRPYWIGSVKALSQEATYGLPSGHASDSLAVWGYLVYRPRRGWAWLLAGGLVFFIGLSRLYLGVHFPRDVLAGWLIGGAVLAAFVRSERQIGLWAARQTVGLQMGAALALSLAVLLAGQLLQSLLSATPDAAAWSAFAAAARSPDYAFTLAGALVGALSGYALMRRYACFQSAGPWLRRAARYVLGILGVAVIYFGLASIFGRLAPDLSAAGLALRYLRYAAATFWVTFLAPWVFLKLKLADPET